MLPQSLRSWFVIHFVVDLIFSVPLILFPHAALALVGQTVVGDALSYRIMGAAFFAIGTTSLLMRNAGLESYRALLNLKILWSSAALVGIMLAIVQDASKIAWLPFGIFVIFWFVWVWYRRALGVAK
jgi:hypothetical protein